MTDKCDFCTEECTQYETIEGTTTQLCDECYDELPVDMYSGERVLDIVARISTPNGDQISIGQDTYDNEVVVCEWRGDECFHHDAIEIGGGDYQIHFNYHDEVRECGDCTYTYSQEDCTYHESDCTSYCNGCIEDHPVSGMDRWNGRYRWYAEHMKVMTTRNYPVKNGIGIEFEVEEGNTITDNDPLVERIAVADEDPSLSAGTEYCTHILQGDEIERTVREMCTTLNEQGFTMSRRAGWHFHYSMKELSVQEQKNVWKTMEMFSTFVLDNHAIDDYAYFKHMLRQYARSWTSGYKEHASTWSKGNSDERIGEFRGWARTDTTQSPQKYSFVNWTHMHDSYSQDNERIEVRLYSPFQWRDKVSTYRRWTTSAYKELADDYLSFIQFWDEFVDLSTRAELVFIDNEYNTLPIQAFAEQFSDDIRDWLVANHEKIQEKIE